MEGWFVYSDRQLLYDSDTHGKCAKRWWMYFTSAQSIEFSVYVLWWDLDLKGHSTNINSISMSIFMEIPWLNFLIDRPISLQTILNDERFMIADMYKRLKQTRSIETIVIYLCSTLVSRARQWAGKKPLDPNQRTIWNWALTMNNNQIAHRTIQFTLASQFDRPPPVQNRMQSLRNWSDLKWWKYHSSFYNFMSERARADRSS